MRVPQDLECPPTASFAVCQVPSSRISRHRASSRPPLRVTPCASRGLIPPFLNVPSCSSAIPCRLPRRLAFRCKSRRFPSHPSPAQTRSFTPRGFFTFFALQRVCPAIFSGRTHSPQSFCTVSPPPLTACQGRGHQRPLFCVPRRLGRLPAPTPPIPMPLRSYAYGNSPPPTISGPRFQFLLRYRLSVPHRMAPEPRLEVAPRAPAPQCCAPIKSCRYAHRG